MTSRICGKCLHFVKIDGMFGGCSLGERTKFDHETFSSNSACGEFEEKPIENTLQEHSYANNNQSRHPFGSLMQMLFSQRPGAALIMGGPMPGLPSCECQEAEEETEKKLEWINPLYKNKQPRKPPQKVIDMEAWRLKKGK